MTRIAALAAALCLSACAVGPDFEKPAPPAAKDYGSLRMYRLRELVDAVG